MADLKLNGTGAAIPPAAEILRRVEAGWHVPELPATTQALIHLFWDGHSSAWDLVHILEGDPELRNRLLLMANRTFFGSSFSVSTVHQAVVRMSFNFSKLWALTHSLSGAFTVEVSESTDPSRFWRKALCRGILCQGLEDYFRSRDREEGFMAGFLWEIGLPVHRAVYAELQGDSCLWAPGSMSACIESERDGLGLDHKQVGAAVLRRLGFPEHMAATQLDLFSGRDCNEIPVLSRICGLGDLFSDLFLGEEEDILYFLEYSSAYLGADQEVMGDILIAVLDMMRNIADKLLIEVDMQKGLSDLLRKASQHYLYLAHAAAAKNGRNPAELPSLETLDVRTASHAIEALAHEIRNPLMVVGGFAKRLVSALNPTSREREYAEIILKEGLRLEEVFKQVRR